VAKRRGNGEGSISRRKDGLYMARYTVETATGAKRKTLYAKTRKEAAEKLTAAMADAWKGIIADGGPKTVGAFLTSWLENSVRGSVRKSTYDRKRIPLSGSPDTHIGSEETQDTKCGGRSGLLPLPARLRV
jgi:integrase